MTSQTCGHGRDNLKMTQYDRKSHFKVQRLHVLEQTVHSMTFYDII